MHHSLQHAGHLSISMFLEHDIGLPYQPALNSLQKFKLDPI